MLMSGVHITVKVLRFVENLSIWLTTCKKPHLMETADYLRGCIQKFPDWVDKEIYTYNNKHSLRSNTKCYGGNTY
jgi:hypothetical protein